MGIPYYVASLIRQHRQIQKDCGNAPLEVDVLGIDFNCFIHKYLNAENPIGSIVLALDDLLTKTVRAKRVQVAFDGLVPYAKIVQQRYRRMRRNTEITMFDKHQISPGTKFMRSLADTLRFMYPNLEISDTLERGEGEHKMFQWIRKFPPGERKRICLYGLDADLVLIAIAQHDLGNIQILREKEKDTGFATISIPELMKVLPADPETYVRMSILCFGNDFLPNFAMFSLREDGYPRAVHYMKTTGMKGAADDEQKVLRKRAKVGPIVSEDGHEIETRMGIHIMDGVLNWEPVVYAFKKTFEWTLHYFKTSEVLDWHWYYPYPEAPLVATWEAYEFSTPFVWEHPEPLYTIEDQLRFILPEESLNKTGLVSTHPDELYDEETETRSLWMKRFPWESDPWVSLPWGKLTTVGAYVPP